MQNMKYVLTRNLRMDPGARIIEVSPDVPWPK